MAGLEFEVSVSFPGTDDLLRALNMEEAGKAQQFFTNEIMRFSDPYVPMDSAAILKNSVHPTPGFDGITYSAPYARYHWFGKLMVDPITGKGSFYDPKTGRHWSRPGVAKVLTQRDINYQGAPMRGAKWTERMWVDHANDILQSTALFIERNKKI